jgi:hypothetical protein
MFKIFVDKLSTILFTEMITILKSISLHALLPVI